MKVKTLILPLTLAETDIDDWARTVLSVQAKKPARSDSYAELAHAAGGKNPQPKGSQVKKRLVYVGRGLRPEWLCDCGHQFSEHSGENNERCSGCACTQAGDLAGKCRADGFTNGLLREVILGARRRLPAVAA